MALKKEYIQRIDDFLQRLGCVYVDIRFEMVDAIASEIENEIVDYDAFFRKNKFEGDFLRYMLSKRVALEKSYYRQAKRKYWFDLWRIVKGVIRYFFAIKNLFIELVSFVVFQKILDYDIKLSIIFIYFSSILISVYSLYFVSKEFKKIGKIRVIYSYYSVLAILFYTAMQIPNIFKIFDTEYHTVFIANFHFILIVFTVLTMLNFANDKNKFIKKYKFLLS